MKQHLIDLFHYNDWANQKLLEAIADLTDKTEALELFSHLVNAQNKWYNRIVQQTEDHSLEWMRPLYAEQELNAAWAKSIGTWIACLESKTETSLEEDVLFTRASDGKPMAVKLKDLALQLNYHAIHHRAQINTLISKQGVRPPATDYIYTKLREL